MSNKKMLFIFNPYSGKGQIKNNLVSILDTFIKAKYQINVHVTQEKGEATRIVRERAQDVDYVVCSGGDGTLHEVVNGVMSLPSEERPSIGYIPTGTTNDYGKSLKIPKDMKKAALMMAKCPSYLTDIGQFNDQYFTYVAGFGIFTAVSYTTPQDAKNMLGHPAYIIEGMKSLADIEPCHVKVISDEYSEEGDYLIGLVTNSISVSGSKLVPGKGAILDDGIFEVMLVKNPENPLAMPQVLMEFLQDNPENNSYVIRFKTSHIKFEVDKKIDWVLDGEFGGHLAEVDIQVKQKALAITRKN
ncbi:Transcription regulator (contains diacylglycerol kinase catalytic domain) [Lachnospiraceae bacterium TWA4]|nr:Transcription regulator (contains diacylglycerol kinase catalytic domain) [Lachnospiraceae bacterium TWA4]